MHTRVDEKLKELLSSKKSYQRWLSLILVLSILVSSATVAIFTEPSQALTDPPRKLCCPYAAHRHTAECENEAGVPCCPMAVAHTHDASCYEDGELICTLPELPAHVHTDECYEEVRVLVCDIPETEGGHVHTDGCYEIRRDLVCAEPELPVHVHTSECFTYGETDGSDRSGDPSADTESEEDRVRSFESAELTGDWAADAAAIAGTQIGYTESAENYIVEGGKVNGYTRYGALYGTPYADWSGLFVYFCLHYAGVDAELMPFDPDCARFAEILTEYNLYNERTEDDAPYGLPETGDLVFFRANGDEIGRVGVVLSADPDGDTFTVAEGDVEGAVVSRTYDIADETVAGFCRLPDNPEKRQTITCEYYAEDGNLYTVLVGFAPRAGIPEGAELSITEPSPEEYIDYAAQTAAALDVSQDELGELLLLDISIVYEGEEIQPASPVYVTIRPEGAAIQDDSQVVHFGDEAQVVNSETVDGEIRFETEGFSVYAIVGTVIEQTVLTSDGAAYRVTVTFGEDAGVPEGSTLEVTELDPDYEYYYGLVAKSEAVLGFNTEKMYCLRLFDIKIVDPYGEKVEIASPVDVRIELIDGAALSEHTQVIHIADGADEGQLVRLTDVDGETVRFEADGFSAYVIVDGPDPLTTGWVKVTSMSDFGTYAADGLYIGHTSGYYFKNVLVSDTGNNPRVGIGKTKPSMAVPYVSQGAVKYYFEPAGGTNEYYIYCYSGDGTNDGTNTKQYVLHTDDGTSSNPTKSLSFTDQANATPFTVSLTTKGFTINDGSWYWNQQGNASGQRFCAWNSASDANNYMGFWRFIEMQSDPYDLDNKTYGFVRYSDGLTGIGMIAEQLDADSLSALVMNVFVRSGDINDKMFVPKNSGISMWTFHWVDDNNYYISTQVGGNTKYLSVDAQGAALSDTPVALKVLPGAGIHHGQICIQSQGGATLTYSGSTASGYGVGGSTVGSEWLHLVQEDVLTADYLMTYVADQISVSDPSITNGTKVLVYTRTWNDTRKRYEYYAIDHDGTLVRVYESGHQIEWLGNRINTLLWNFTEYYWEGTNDPNGYYELYNEYSQKYIAPQLSSPQHPGGQILSDNTIGINLNGRKNGYYYSDILAWDDPSYSYSGLKIENGRIVPCPKDEAIDFYFATIQDLPEDDSVHSVPTVDNNLFGIKMRMVNFKPTTTTNYTPDGTTTTQMQHSVIGYSRFDSSNSFAPYAGLLNNYLDANGYPTATRTGKSLAELFDNEQNHPIDVNHLFIQSIYDGTGYFEFDSAHNSASLIDPATGQVGTDFTVYHELASTDTKTSNTLKHGQFFPYDHIDPGVFNNNNPYNMFDIFAQPLPDSDPRKGERLYNILNPDYYFGMQLEASFVQTLNGKDAWGHDIIFEFSGDDDFWFYVDGELVLDLGGIHSAISGTVNFCTGVVTYPDNTGTMITTTLYDVFRGNYEERGMSQAEIDQRLYELFEDDGSGHMIFRDYTSHDMKIFYMERGAGASNLHMRFNLASVKEGTVRLSKEVSGVDDSDSLLTYYPYQIWYRTKDSEGVTYDHLLDNTSLTDPNLIDVKVVYTGSNTPVLYNPSITVDGVTYNNVYLLKPGESADITFPDETILYWIVECGIDPNIYESVSVNGSAVTGIAGGSDSNAQDHGDVTDVGTTGTSGGNREDYPIGSDTTRNRSRVVYDNEVDSDALRELTITKKLYDVTGQNEIPYDPNNPVTFSLRLYFKSEFDTDFVAANMCPYHVKDPNGNYCRWDSSLQRFVSLGVTDYTQLTSAEKQSATFHTSMNGSISKIPAFYTIEVREILAGTEYKVQERDYEVPDGYSLMKYVLYDQNAVPQGTESLFQPVSGTMPSDTTERDPHVDVCNVKGFGLRVYKSWTDKGYMSYRDPTYFAVFRNDNFTVPVSGTLRQLPYNANPESLYWYFDVLDSGYTFANYVVREVELVNPTVDANGYVTSYTSLTVLNDHDTVDIDGTQTGDTGTTSYEYTVHYESELMHDTNVRVYNIANARTGIEIRKLEWGDTSTWGGSGLNGATFKLERVVPGGDNILIGTFTSRDFTNLNNNQITGFVTEAYLSEDVDYILTETRAPQSCYGLQHPLTLRMHGGVLTVVGDLGETDYYRVTAGASYDGGPLLEIRNRSYDVRFEKKDGSTLLPLEGVHFSLHKEVTVGGVTQLDFTPMTGYEDLVTTVSGMIPLINNTLIPGNYGLKETQALPGYRTMSGYLLFTIDGRGNVTITSPGRENWLQRRMEGDTIVYSFSVPNVRDPIILKKVGFNNSDPSAVEFPVSGAVFGIYTDLACTVPFVLNGVTQTGLTDSGNGVFFNETIPPGDYYILETSAPSGYQMLPGPILLRVAADGTPTVTKTWAGGDPSAAVGTVTHSTADGYTITIRNSAGYELPQTGGPGTVPVYALGAALILTPLALLIMRFRRKRRREE